MFPEGTDHPQLRACGETSSFCLLVHRPENPEVALWQALLAVEHSHYFVCWWKHPPRGLSNPNQLILKLQAKVANTLLVNSYGF